MKSNVKQTVTQMLLTGLVGICPLFVEAREASEECIADSAAIEGAIAKSEKLMRDYIDSVQEIMGKEDAYGISIAVGVCGEVAWQAGYGFADLEQNVPVTPQTKFRIGSVSKTLTGTALGQLMEAGKLDMDSEVQAYVPTFPKKKYPITVRQVAGHLAGIRHYNGEEFLSSKSYGSVLEGLEIFADDPLLHEPGTKFKYSTYGWNLLSAVVEGASGEEFLDYMQRHVFQEVGMDSTVPDQNAKIIPSRSRFYHFDEEQGVNQNAHYVDLSNKWAGGGFLSTPSDIVVFGHAMMSEELVTNETFSLFTTSQADKDGVMTNYGIGWFADMRVRELDRAKPFFDQATLRRTTKILEDNALVGHSGGSVGGLTLFVMAPDSDANVVVTGVSNNSGFFPAFVVPVAAEFIDASNID